MNADKPTYEVGQPVWAKVHSYPWWPGVVIEHSSLDVRPRKALVAKVHFIPHDNK